MLPLIDDEGPTLECPEDITEYADGTSSVPVEWTVPKPKDNSGLDVSMNSTHESNDYFFIGETVVTYFAWDIFENVATCSFTIIIISKYESMH